MLSVPLFKNLDQSSDGLLTRGFPIGKTTVDIESAAHQDIAFKGSGAYLLDQSVDGSVEISHQPRITGLNIKGTVKNEKQKAVYIAEASLENKPIDGLKATLSCQLSSSNNKPIDLHPKISTLYRYGNTANVEGVLNLTDSYQLGASCVTARDSIRVGSSIDYSISNSEKKNGLRECSAKFQYAPHNNFAITTFWSFKDRHQTGASIYYRNESSRIQSALSASFDPFELGTPPTFQTAISLSIDPVSEIKARLSSKDKSLALAYKVQLSKVATMTAGVQLKSGLSKSPADNFEHGFSLNFKL